MKKRRILIPVKLDAERKIILEADEAFIKAALTEDGEPVEFMSSSWERESAVGNIYVGRVEAVNRSGFAFVDIGLERNAFLNLNDNKDADNAGEIKAGMILAVQVIKDAIRDKGAYVTTSLTWPGRFFVAETAKTGQTTVSVSKKITAQKERDRLAGIALGLLGDIGFGGRNLIIRTDAMNAAPSSLEAELRELAEAVKNVEASIAKACDEDSGIKPPVLAYKPYPSVCAMMTAELMQGAGHSVKEIVINNETEHGILQGMYAPKGVKVTLVTEKPFKKYSLDKVLDSTRHRMVNLPSGGHILIERTEACIVVDVNSGQYSGRKNMEDMALKINLEAARETARQLRFRNLGGIIIIDFIGMKDAEHVQAVTDELKNALARDSAPTVVEGMTKLGLMEMTRKRTRNPLWG